MPLWYMPDEFGVRIGHSHMPNCRMVPIFHMPENITYNLLFPIQNIEVEGNVLVLVEESVIHCVLVKFIIEIKRHCRNCYS